MLYRTIFSLVISSTLLTACGGGGSSKISEQPCTAKALSGDLIPSCDTGSVTLKNGVNSLDLASGTRTETIDFNCDEGPVTGIFVTDYQTGVVSVTDADIPGSNNSISCSMSFVPPLLPQTIAAQDIDELLNWGDDLNDPTFANIDCPAEIIDLDQDRIIAECSGSLKVDFDFTDTDGNEHSFNFNLNN